MSMMTKLMAAGALALTMAAGATQAAVITQSTGVTGDPNCNQVFGVPAANINVLAGASFNAEFESGTSAGFLCFNLNNTSSLSQVVTLAVATVNQLGEDWGFLGGVTLNSTMGGLIWSLGQGEYGAEDFSFLMNPNSTVYFDWAYGQAYASSENLLPEIDFIVKATPVPVPAAGFLLIGALGGLAAMRRRKTA